MACTSSAKQGYVVPNDVPMGRKTVSVMRGRNLLVDRQRPYQKLHCYTNYQSTGNVRILCYNLSYVELKVVFIPWLKKIKMRAYCRYIDQLCIKVARGIHK